MSALFDDDLVYDDDAAPVDNSGNVQTQENVALDLTSQTNTTLIGHVDIQARLVHFINEDRVPHAMVFTGPPGVGKATMAYQLARTLLTHISTGEGGDASLFGDPEPQVTKLQKLGGDPKHPDMARFLSGGHPDFMVLAPDADSKSGNILVDDARRVPGFLSLKSARTDGWRVVLIDDAHRLNVAAQNALLKIIEEPPPRTLLVLITSNLSRLLPTIRSRSHVVHFDALPPEQFAQAVRLLSYQLSGEDLRWAEALSNGCPGRIAHIQEIEGIALIREFLGLWTNWPKFDEPAWYAFTENLAGAGAKEVYVFILEFWQWWARALCMAKVDGGRRAQLQSLIGPQLMAMVDGFSLAELLEISEKVGELAARAEAASLEPRQVIYSARLLMSKG